MTCRLDRRKYPTGRQVSNEEMKRIKMRPNPFHGEWNYVIEPSSPQWSHATFIHLRFLRSGTGCLVPGLQKDGKWPLSRQPASSIPTGLRISAEGFRTLGNGHPLLFQPCRGFGTLVSSTLSGLVSDFLLLTQGSETLGWRTESLQESPLWKRFGVRNYARTFPSVSRTPFAKVPFFQSLRRLNSKR